jgi:hypothetical protein
MAASSDVLSPHCPCNEQFPEKVADIVIYVFPLNYHVHPKLGILGRCVEKDDTQYRQ